MTKMRAPLSFERSLVRIADVLDWAPMGALIGKAGRTVMDYSDPDTATGISLEDAYTLESAYVAAGGEGRPISDCWSMRLRMTPEAQCRDELHRRVAHAFKEGGDAQVALMAAIAPNADAIDRRVSRREVVEHIEALTRVLALLDDGEAPVTGAIEAPS